MARITVYRSSKHFITNRIDTRTIDENEELPKGCYYTEKEALDAYDKKQEDLRKDYEKNKPIAMEKLNKLEESIRQLLKESKCDLYLTYEGDSHGIYSESLEISCKVGNHEYTKQVEF